MFMALASLETSTEFDYLCTVKGTHCYIPYFHCKSNFYPTVILKILVLPEQVVTYFSSLVTA